ncbi:hypothetical protein [Actinomyces trachealis]|uniref:hypothetical protein n=1 Tax=Actinomyces trachealis TaxID=2763540 RepID=UPI0018928FDB|nr:hypothetical protein [Actinomyces trachealis]
MAATRATLLGMAAQRASTAGRPIRVAAVDPSAGTSELLVSPDGAVAPASARHAVPVPAVTSAPVPAPPASFLASTAATGPSPTGWRALAARLGFHVEASESECQQWVDERAVVQHWPGPRTVAVLNGKGGAGKTPTAILLAGYFARLGSGSVVAADGNVMRGDIG